MTSKEEAIFIRIADALETIGERLLFSNEKLDEVVDQLASMRSLMEEGAVCVSLVEYVHEVGWVQK